VSAVPQLPHVLPDTLGHLLPRPTGGARGGEERIAELLAGPASVRSIHRPVVTLADGRCVGYQASLRVARSAARAPGPWFRAAARSGLSGQLGALALEAALRARGTLPGERFLVVELDPEALCHPDVIGVLTSEDDVADLVVSLISAELPPVLSLEAGRAGSHPARRVLDELRGRGMRLAATAGKAGLDDLLAVERLHPDLVLLPADLIRGVQLHPLRQRLIDVVVALADGAGAATLAEEVETPDEVLALRAAGVRMAQGWLFGRARPGFVPPSSEICEWLRSQQTRSQQTRSRQTQSRQTQGS
jgi:EAL domain-containing protein (putative c-di-GMP-specific phosphodiesterase class I)